MVPAYCRHEGTPDHPGELQTRGLAVYAALPTRKLIPARVVAMLDFVSSAAEQVFSTKGS